MNIPRCIKVLFVILNFFVIFGNEASADTYQFVRQWGGSGSGSGQLSSPKRLAMDSSNYIYVVDSFNHRIQKFDARGTFVTQWGSYGSGSGQFDTPTGIAVDRFGNVYVSDTNNDRIQKFESSGNFVKQWGTQGSQEGQFDSPNGVAVDASGNVYVADGSNGRIQKFDSNGRYLLSVGPYVHLVTVLLHGAEMGKLLKKANIEAWAGRFGFQGTIDCT